MLRYARCLAVRRRVFVAAAIFVGVIAFLVPNPPVFALITGGEGNSPLHDPGWPNGAAAIFNNSARVAWWEGPPFGGGQWHAECRGDAKALSSVLADFTKLDAKNKRVVIHDGVGHSFWLNPNREPEKAAAAKIRRLRFAGSASIHGRASTLQCARRFRPMASPALATACTASSKRPAA